MSETTFAELLIVALSRVDRTIEDIATEAGMSRDTIQKLKRGQRSPLLSTAQTLARILDAPELLGVEKKL